MKNPRCISHFRRSVGTPTRAASRRRCLHRPQPDLMFGFKNYNKIKKKREMKNTEYLLVYCQQLFKDVCKLRISGGF